MVPAKLLVTRGVQIGGRLSPSPTSRFYSQIDTVTISAEAMTIALVWRAVFPSWMEETEETGRVCTKHKQTLYGY